MFRAIFASALCAIVLGGCAVTTAYKALNPTESAIIQGESILSNNKANIEGTLVIVNGVDGRVYRSKDINAYIDACIHNLSVDIEKNFSWAGGGHYSGDAQLNGVNLESKKIYQLACDCASPKLPAIIKLIDTSSGTIIALSKPKYLTRTNMGGVTILTTKEGQHDVTPH